MKRELIMAALDRLDHCTERTVARMAKAGPTEMVRLAERLAQYDIARALLHDFATRCTTI